MKRENYKKILCILLWAILLCCALAGCGAENEEKQTTETTIRTTTEPTTVTTTEDEKTTFAQENTKKIYKGLDRDANGNYPYKIASYSTSYNSGDKTRTENLKIAASKVNDIVIPDGQVFSFNQTVGKRTVTAGYKTAKVVKDGEFVDGLGGGVCQISSTLFECVLRANVEIVSRTCHTLKVQYVPLGGDATVQWNSKDFQFKNTTGSDIRIKMVCDGGRLNCAVYAKDDINVGNVNIKIKKSGENYILTRTVNGRQNYRTVSRYREAKS